MSAEDFEWLSQWRWSFIRGYGYRHVREDGRVTTRLLHREILGLEPGDPRQADHINRNRFDNRRSNLRIVTGAQNWQNVPARGGTSEFRGVSWDRRRCKWAAQIQVNGKVHNLGRYSSEEEAAAVALTARQRAFTHAVD